MSSTRSKAKPTSPGVHKPEPRAAHFFEVSLPSVAVDGRDAVIRFDYPGGYDLHRLSLDEARKISAELELAIKVLAGER